MRIINLTPHTLTFRNSEGVDIEFPPQMGRRKYSVARVATTSVPVAGALLPTIRTIWGGVEGLPPVCETCGGSGCVEQPQEQAVSVACPDCRGSVLYIVSLLVLSHPEVKGRTDVVAPATGPNDGAIRFEDGPRKGQIIAVTRFVAA